MRSLLAFLFLLATSAPAVAAEPVTTVAEDGTVTGVVVLPQTEAEILAFLADPTRADQLVDEVVESRSSPDGRCTRVSRSVKGMWNPLRYVVRRCRTPKGWSEQLVEAGDFRRHEAEWEVSTTAAGTRVRYRVHSDPNLPVPKALVRSRTRAAIDRLLRRVGSALRK